MSTKTKLEKAWDDDWLCCSLPPTGSANNASSTFKKEKNLEKGAMQTVSLGDKKVVIFTERVVMLEGIKLKELLELRNKKSTKRQ